MQRRADLAQARGDHARSATGSPCCARESPCVTRALDGLGAERARPAHGRRRAAAAGPAARDRAGAARAAARAALRAEGLRAARPRAARGRARRARRDRRQRPGPARGAARGRARRSRRARSRCCARRSRWCSGDRQRTGLVLELSVAENLVLPEAAARRRAAGVPARASCAPASSSARREAAIARFAIRAAAGRSRARALGREPAEALRRARAARGAGRARRREPDARARRRARPRAVREELRAQARAGTAVLVISTELDEVLELGQRIAVLFRGRLLDGAAPASAAARRSAGACSARRAGEPAARARRRSSAAVALVIALALAGGWLALLGADPRARRSAALASGAFGDAVALESTAVRAGPLLLVGLGVALSFRCGIWNIGGEGQLLGGALAATALATRALGAAPAVVASAARARAPGARAGAAWAGIAALLRVRRGVSEVLSTILLNFIAALLVAWAVHGPLQEASGAYPQSDAFPDAARLALLPGLHRAHAGLVLAALLPFALWLLLFRTAAGLRLRAVGLSPDAARYARVSPERETRARAADLGRARGPGRRARGDCGVTGRLFENLATGYGFTAIAVALLARLHPLGVLPAALFFAALAAGSGAMQRVGRRAVGRGAGDRGAGDLLLARLRAAAPAERVMRRADAPARSRSTPALRDAARAGGAGRARRRARGRPERRHRGDDARRRARRVRGRLRDRVVAAALGGRDGGGARARARCSRRSRCGARPIRSSPARR